MKIFLSVLKWILLCVLGLLLLVFILLVLDRDYQSTTLSDSNKKSVNAEKEYFPDVDSSRYYSLSNEFGNNKTLAEGFEIQCLTALSHYPELKEAHIDFLIRPAFLPLSSRPDPISILIPWIKRRYLVVISNATADFFEPILLEKAPFNEQVGIIGHELAHSLYYLDKSALQLAGIAYRYHYNVDNFVTEFEREADKLAIAHGLGYQLYDFAFFVRKAFGQSQSQIEQEEGDTYLSPKEIAIEMEKYDFYEDSLDHPDTYF